MPVLGGHPLRLDDPLDRIGRVADGATLLEASGCSLSGANRSYIVRGLTSRYLQSHVPVGGVSESPLAAMHRGDALAILGTRRGVRACERGGRT
jgi:hypothetical protein